MISIHFLKIYFNLIIKFINKIKISMAARESFYTKSEPRFYKEVYKQNVNIRDFNSQINPLAHVKNNDSSIQ
jgi:hypothetical protein